MKETLFLGATIPSTIIKEKKKMKWYDEHQSMFDVHHSFQK